MKKHIIILTSLLLISCSKEDCENGSRDLQTCFDENISYSQDDNNYRDYKDNLTRWECLDISNYEVTYKAYMFGCYESKIRLRIENNSLVEQTVLPNSNPFSSDCVPATVEYMYSIIAEAVDSTIVFPGLNPEPEQTAYEVYISYDTEFFFPDSIYVNYFEFIEEDEFVANLFDFKSLD